MNSDLLLLASVDVAGAIQEMETGPDVGSVVFVPDQPPVKKLSGSLRMMPCGTSDVTDWMLPRATKRAPAYSSDVAVVAAVGLHDQHALLDARGFHRRRKVVAAQHRPHVRDALACQLGQATGGLRRER